MKTQDRSFLSSYIGVRLPADLLQRIERLAIHEQTTTSAIVREAVVDLISNRGVNADTQDV